MSSMKGPQGSPHEAPQGPDVSFKEPPPSQLAPSEPDQNFMWSSAKNLNVIILSWT